MQNKNVSVFDEDSRSHGGYIYTTTDRLSSRLATQRSTDVILKTGHFRDRAVLDMGCGDGFYTVRFWDGGAPRLMVGMDAAPYAVKAAHQRKAQRPISLVVGDAHALPFPNDSFDVVLIQSILHHDDKPAGIIKEAFRVAPEIIIHEPNGNNLGLKIIEKTSRYHREHHEKSYTSRQLRRWVEEAGGKVSHLESAGFVPMFCPDWIARAMKAVEPLIERTPLLNTLGCAVIVLEARR